jgi:hypothetical protein
MSVWKSEINDSRAIGAEAADSGPSDLSWPDPPDLAQRSATPAYDAHDLVALLGVPANILLGWEQSLGIPRPILVPDEQGTMLPRYSERDLVAALWLRDQIRAGMPPIAAARHLLSAQQPLPQLPAPSASTAPTAPPRRSETSGPLGRSNLTTGAYPTATPSLRGHSGPFGSVSRTGPTSAPLPPWPGQAGLDQLPSGARGSPSGALGRPSGPLARGQSRPLSPPSGPLARPSGPLGRLSGPLTGALGRPSGTLTGSLGRGTGASPSTGNLHMYQSALLNAFAALDPNETQRLLNAALAEHAIEAVCLSLLQPLAIRSAELVAGGRLSPAAEQFGALMVRNRLAMVLDSLRVNPAAPLALRAIYLGPNVAEETIIALARAHWQALVCLSAATDAGARQIVRVAAAIARTEPPRPLLGYGGGAFVRAPELQRQVKDSYFLGLDAHMATRHVIQLLTQGPVKAR